MPTYTYECLSCGSDFELFFYIKDYQSQPNCVVCGKNNTNRCYASDILTQATSIKKADSELKTIGDLAKRNADRLSEDEKIHLYRKHNAYKDEVSQKQLPTGMSRMDKPKKIKWPGSNGKIKRKFKK
jgi:putative FmdB family regulatory protein